MLRMYYKKFIITYISNFLGLNLFSFLRKRGLNNIQKRDSFSSDNITFTRAQIRDMKETIYTYHVY